MLRERLRARARLNDCIRAFFAARDVLEVETPILATAGTTDPAIESFVTQDASVGDCWLRTSPEFFHKRLLSAGSGPVYELGRVFRSGELSRRHNPEFTLLEWYRPGFDEAALMDEVEALLQACAAAFGRRLPACPRWTFASLFEQYCGLDPLRCSDAALTAAVSELGMMGTLDRDACMDALRSLRIEPALDPAGALFVTDFPASQAALARLKPGEPATAARFELYLGRLELANGYHELCDAQEQARRFAADAQVRAQRGQPSVAADPRFLAALAGGMPDCAGVALGVDRLLMWLLDEPDIAAVLAFPFAEA